jgi:hypothetical protein
VVRDASGTMAVPSSLDISHISWMIDRI